MLAINLSQDMHVHSQFSDGKDSLRDNLLEAKRRGLSRLGCVDHVRRDSTWVPDYARAAREESERCELPVWVGVEAKILDVNGQLDLPNNLGGVTHVYAADHQVPVARGLKHPKEVKEGFASKELFPEQVIEDLVHATCAAMQCEHTVVVAHLFSVLPKIGLDESLVPTALVNELVQTAKATGSIIEIDERWRCPSAAIAQRFIVAGVEVVASTDAHRANRIGRYDYVKDVALSIGAAQ